MIVIEYSWWVYTLINLHTVVLVELSVIGPGNVLSAGVFLLIRIHMGSRNKSSLAAQAAILGNFFNLHKCKMAAARYVNMCYTRTARANVKCNTSFKGSFVH